MPRRRIYTLKITKLFKEEEMRKIAKSSTAAWLRQAFGLAVLFLLLLPTSSWAHGFAGQRFFPTTFQVDDPFISDEFSILINRAKGPDATTTEIDIDYSKRIVPNFGLEFHEAYLHQRASDGSSANGWDNLGYRGEMAVSYECAP